MKLHSYRRSRSDRRRETITLVLTPRDYSGIVSWSTDKAVRIVGDRQWRGVEESVLRLLDVIPSDLRHSFRRKP
jgi:hypothetical protein